MLCLIRESPHSPEAPEYILKNRNKETHLHVQIHTFNTYTCGHTCIKSLQLEYILHVLP